jgi:CHAD domain
VVAPVRRRHSRLEGISGLSRDLTQQRAAALARAQDAVRSPQFRALTLEIAAWLESGQCAAQAYIRSQAHAGWTLIRPRYDHGCVCRKPRFENIGDGDHREQAVM